MAESFGPHTSGPQRGRTDGPSLESHDTEPSSPHVDAAEALRPQTPRRELQADGGIASDSGMEAIT